MHAPAQDTSYSFAAVYRDHFGFVWRTLRALGVADGAVDDALQDVFVVVHRRLPEFEERAPVGAWLYEIARRIAHRYRTRAARDAARSCELPELAGAGDLEHDLDQVMAGRVMQQFLWALDEDRRRAYVLSEFSGMPGREIAEALGVNMNTIYARIRSARTELDRTAKRMRAQDSAFVVRTLRRRQPSPGAKQRTRAVVLAVVAGPVKTVGLGLGVFAWAVGGLCVGGMALAWWAAAPTTPPAESVPAVATVVGAPPPVQTLAPLPQPGPVEVERPLAGAADQTPKPARRRRVQVEQSSLAEELRLIDAIRAAIKVGRKGAAQSAISAYRGEFSRGALREEVDALDVELACTTHASDARARLEGFRKASTDAGLLARLRVLCEDEVAPQKPGATGIDTR